MSDEHAKKLEDYRASKRDYRNVLLKGLYEQQTAFDKGILTLASGALALSLLFIERVCPGPNKRMVCLLVAAWAGFAVSILATLVSFLTANKGHECQIKNLEAEAEGSERAKCLSKWTSRLNLASIVLFILGVVV